jgi:hypothetical protein
MTRRVNPLLRPSSFDQFGVDGARCVWERGGERFELWA